MLLNDAFKLFLADRESYCSAKTLVYYHDNVPRFFGYLFDCLGQDAGSLDCSDVTRSHVTGFVSSLRCSGRKNTTVNTYFRAVKVFLNYCIGEGYCEPDILRKVKFLKNDAAPVVPLSGPEVDEIDGLFNWNTETGMRNLCIVHLMLDAGFRSSEVVNLQYSGINFNGNYLTVKGKGDKYRSVLLCPKLKRMLSHYLIKFRSCVPGDDYLVFARIGSQEPLTAEYIKQLFARVRPGPGLYACTRTCSAIRLQPVISWAAETLSFCVLCSVMVIMTLPGSIYTLRRRQKCVTVTFTALMPFFLKACTDL